MKEVVKQVKGLTLGDLVKVEWYDASIGKSLSGGLNGIDVPVTSWGIFIGLLGQKNKHIILAQNNFRYADGLTTSTTQPSQPHGQQTSQS
jgi:hypothetical protein